MPIRPLIPTMLLVLSLAACGNDQPDAPPPVASPATSVTTPAATPAATPGAATAPADFQVIPAALPACSPPSVVTLKWDMSATHPGVKQVEVWVGPDAQPVLFTAMGGKDETKTGPWATPGSIFRLRDMAGKELARVVLGGTACPAG